MSRFREKKKTEGKSEAITKLSHTFLFFFFLSHRNKEEKRQCSGSARRVTEGPLSRERERGFSGAGAERRRRERGAIHTLAVCLARSLGTLSSFLFPTLACKKIEKNKKTAIGAEGPRARAAAAQASFFDFSRGQRAPHARRVPRGLRGRRARQGRDKARSFRRGRRRLRRRQRHRSGGLRGGRGHDRGLSQVQRRGGEALPGGAQGGGGRGEEAVGRNRAR